MVEVIHENSKRVVVRTNNGKILFIGNNQMKMKLNNNGRNETKRFEYDDLITMNEALQKIFPGDHLHPFDD